MSEPTVRRATSADTQAAGATLATAFHDDPVLSYLLPVADQRPARATRFFMMMTRIQLGLGHVYLQAAAGQGPPAGVAIWAPPGHWKLPTATIVRTFPELTRVFGAKTPRSLGVLTTMEKRHPPEPPHWYLEFVGTAPSRRGHGVATAVLTPVLEQADAESVPAYLENSNEVNLGLYARLGFEVTATFAVAKGGRTMWSMWREPRSG